MLLPQAPGLQLDALDVMPTAIVITLTSTSPCAPCPDCGTPSLRVRVRYLRTLADLPWGPVPVTLSLQVRKFACTVTTCRRRIFTERLPEVVAPYARRTVRLNNLVQRVGFALGGAAGSRLLDRLHMAALPSMVSVPSQQVFFEQPGYHRGAGCYIELRKHPAQMGANRPWANFKNIANTLVRQTFGNQIGNGKLAWAKAHVGGCQRAAAHKIVLRAFPFCFQ